MMEDGNWGFLKAQLEYAQYWHHEDGKSEPSIYTPKGHAYRSLFARDRDRIMHSAAFRRLSSKTQVFNSSLTDSLRNRLTHTLEVSQIARTISNNLGFDTDLTEAIALAHDLGHTPFGHVGERTLNGFSQGINGEMGKKEKDYLYEVPENFYGFKHNLQTLRVLADYSANDYFSNYVMYGVREHSKTYWERQNDTAFYSNYDKFCSYEYEDKKTQIKKIIPAWSFESFIVAWADEIAQRHHDMEDAFIQKIIPPNDIVKMMAPLSDCVEENDIVSKYNQLKVDVAEILSSNKEKDYFVKTLSSFLIDAYVTQIITEFRKSLERFCDDGDIHSKEDFNILYTDVNEKDIKNTFKFLSSRIYSVDNTLGKSLKQSIIDSYQIQRMDGKGAYIVRKLMRAYISNPQQLPNQYINRLIKIELERFLGQHEYKRVIDEIKSRLSTLSTDVAENTLSWPDYICREALKIIGENKKIYEKIFPVLIRVIFDYIAGMSDSFASSQYLELYGI